MKLYNSIFFLLLALFISGCSVHKNYVQYARDYIEVGKLLDSVDLPYVVHLEKGNRALLVLGVSHTYNVNDPQIGVIERNFRSFNPRIVVNEGGSIDKHFQTMQEAVASNGEAGLLKYLSGLNNKVMVNGDIEDAAEYKLMLRKYPKDDLFLYYIMERLIIPHFSGAYGKRSIDELYVVAVQKWFIDQGFPVDEELKTFQGFQQLYLRKMGHDLKLTINSDLELFDYTNANCKYCKIGRDSKIVRDSVLLERVGNEVKKYKRVMVVFGHGHVLALEPAFRKMMGK